MVPSPSAVYFPALDKCFSGEQPLLSWESASRTFSLLDAEQPPPALDAFLADESVLSILCSPHTPFSPPSPQSKSDFETRTAAIHVLPSTDGLYDIKQIKDDALWLSKEAGINEVQALRIVLLEWQNKASAQLLSEWSEEERLSVQNVTALATFRASTAPLPDQQPAAHTSLFDKEDNRHARLLTIYAAEASSILHLSAALAGFSLPQDLQPSRYPDTPRPGLARVAKSVWDAHKHHSQHLSFVECCDTLTSLTASLSDPDKWPKIVAQTPELTAAYTKSLLSQMVSVLRLAYLHSFRSDSITGSPCIKAWFELMDQHAFFSDLPAFPDTPDSLLIIQCLVALISVSLLKAKEVIDYLRASSSDTNEISYPELSDASYWSDDQSIRLITNTLLGAVAQRIRHVGPAILVWSYVAQALRDIATTVRAERQVEDSSDNERSPGLVRTSSLRDSRGPATKFDERLDLIMDTVPGDDPIAIMGTSAVGDLQAFETVTAISEALLLTFSSPQDLHLAICAKTTLLSLIREGYPCFQYGPDLVQAIISTISYDTVPPSLSHARLRNPAQPIKAFMEDVDVMKGRFLEQARQRYGYELRPFLKSLLSISQSRASLAGDESEVLSMLDEMATFTQVLPISFEAYDLVQEDDMQNYIQLSADLPIFSSRGFRGQTLALTSSESEDGLKMLSTIPAGTVGFVLSTQKPHVVRWDLQHSGLEYLGSLLSTRLPNASIVDAATQAPVDKETAAEIIALIDSLISTETSVDNVHAATHIISRLSQGLSANDDIVRVVFEIFEQELQAQIDQPAAEGSLYLLVHCARFLQSMIRVYPERIWSLFTRSRLLSISDSSGALATIVTATELPLGQYDFLRCCVGIFEGLVDDSVKRAVSRKATTKALTRFDDRNASMASTPDKLMSATLAAFQRIMLDVLQSLPSWKFVFASERCEINTRILNTMTSVLRQAYGIDDGVPVSTKLTGVFAQAGDVILNAFLVENPHELTFHPILTVFLSTIADSDDRTATSNERLDRDQTIAALKFCSTALDVGMLAGQKIEFLTLNILQSMPLVARLFAARHYYKLHVAKLMASVVRSLSTTGGEPASLLGYLGSEAMKCFLAVIAELDLPLQDIDTEVAIWNMLSVVVSNKQQWLAVCLLTGSTPRDKLKEKASDRTSPAKVRKPLFGHALEQLANINMLSPKLAIAILTFIARAQDNWSWATNGIGRHTDVINNLTDWIASLTPNPRPSDMEAVTRTANENQMAALIVDILARYLHNARQLGDVTTAKTVASKLEYLRDHGVAVDGYNHSLHKNLSKNFGAKFPQCSLSSFKRTALNSAEFGREYYYDRTIAGKMLDFDAGWSRKTGFADEFARANVNLSLVESQVNLLKSWKALAIGLGQFASDNVALQTDLALVASKSLKANMDALIPAALFDNIAQIRADLAFVLIQRLTLIKSKETEVKSLLSTAWDALRTSEEDFETISTARDAYYYRTLLRTLFLSIQPHIYDPTLSPAPGKSTAKRPAPAAPSVAPMLLEILERVITINFRALCSAVHADTSSVEPSDFVLLTALLQSILRVPDMANAHTSVAAIFASAGTARYAASLYSWADQLAAATETGDPIFGELSILFLLELSSVPLLAEQMAVDGVLSRLSSANLSQYFRSPNGKGAFDEPTRMFSIWSRGMLPLCLNLLEAVGPPIAAEIGAFLNSFPEQLKRAETDLENKQPTLRKPYAGNVTLGMAAETYSLSLINLILERLKAVGPAAGINSDEVPSLVYDRGSVKEELDGLLRGRRAMRERIVPVGERETEWIKQKPEKAGQSESRLEEKIATELEAALVCLTG